MPCAQPPTATMAMAQPSTETPALRLPMGSKPTKDFCWTAEAAGAAAFISLRGTIAGVEKRRQAAALGCTREVMRAARTAWRRAMVAAWCEERDANFALRAPL